MVPVEDFHILDTVCEGDRGTAGGDQRGGPIALSGLIELDATVQRAGFDPYTL